MGGSIRRGCKMKKERQFIMKMSENLYQAIRAKNEYEYNKIAKYVNALLEALLLPYNPWLEGETELIIKETERIVNERKNCYKKLDDLLKQTKEKGIFNW
jgi:recombinational DNA repair ATPase RecF